uniref:Uncharacterized protein n=1 Tax=Photinus pyralis TaxID=7054 RepID=A0A1Y1LXK6_PHOPY
MDCPYQQYYVNQAGSGIGTIYRGSPYQRGHGIGSWLGGVFRSILPLFKSGMRAVGKEALRTGANVLGDIIEEKPIKAAFQERVQEAGRNLKRKADDKIDTLMHGSGYKRPHMIDYGQFKIATEKKTTRPKKAPKRKVVKPTFSDIFSKNGIPSRTVM